MKVDPWDTAYAAGLFDGEGYVGIQNTNNDRTGTRHRRRVTIVMCDPEPLEFLQERYGGRVYRRSTDSRGGRVTFGWHMTAREDIDAFLQDILPFSICKREQIEEALRYPYPERWACGGNPVPSEITALRQEISDNLKAPKEPRDDL